MPPKGDLRAAWLLRCIQVRQGIVPFDLAVDGRFVRRHGKDRRRMIFRTFGQQELVVYKDDASYDRCSNADGLLPSSAARLLLRHMHGDDGYYLAFCLPLIKQRNSPPPPNPEGSPIDYTMRPK